METPSLPRAGFWIRFFATALDAALFMIIFGILIHPRRMEDETLGMDWWNFSMIVWLAYHVFMWTWKGTTIGGIITGIKVVRLDARPLDFPVALVRALAAVLSFFVLCLGFFWAGFGSDKKSWHDKIAGTVIVKVPPCDVSGLTYTAFPNLNRNPQSRRRGDQNSDEELPPYRVVTRRRNSLVRSFFGSEKIWSGGPDSATRPPSKNNT